MQAEFPKEEVPIPATILGDVLWRRVDETGLEHCQLSEVRGHHAISGCVLGVVEGSPYRVNYLVLCGPDWVTRKVHVQTLHGSVSRRLEMEREDSGRWRANGEALEALEGLTDIDLSITPSTNTLPIRRLELEIGADAATDAVWVRFPELTVERLPQRYLRLGDGRYRYESRGGSFTAELDVDREGIVIRYGQIWERVAG